MSGYRRTTAEELVAGSRLPGSLRDLNPGPFGLTSLAVESLEELTTAADLSFEGRRQLESLLVEELKKASGASDFHVPKLELAHVRLLGTFQIVVLADSFARWGSTVLAPPQVEGGLELEGLESLLAESAEVLIQRLLDIAGGFLNQTAIQQPLAAKDPEATVRTLLAGFALLKNTATRYAEAGVLAPLVRVLEKHPLSFSSAHYRAFTEVSSSRAPTEGLLNISVDDIVGNTDYLEAAKRLARDVAGFDLERGVNPKKLNPVLFALGRPGCGKTVSAHAIGHYFLDYCKERSVPARFIVIRRSDWASSYQNASASNLIRLFEEQVKNFDGVCGIYWPDIDTALASRDSGKLRSEEKQNLGAVFSIFDGTLLPKDGSWFMMCDANTMHMDEAAISRIAQNPMTVSGATTPDDYARMMRDVCLKDVQPFLPQGPDDWKILGRRAAEHDLTGRNIEAICGNVRSNIQDFEYPDEYFALPPAERRNLVSELSTHITIEKFLEAIDDFAQFHLDAERREDELAFDRDVDGMVRQLNASRAAAKSLSLDS